jgi:type II secretory pathway component PulF
LDKHQPIAVDYAGPRPGADKPLTSIPLTIVLCLFYGLIAMIAFLVAPLTERIFQDFKTDLPAVTTYCLIGARWFRNAFGWAMLLPLVFGIPVLAAQLTWQHRTAQDRRIQRLRMIIISLAAMLFLTILTGAALFAPLMNVLWSVSSPGK